MAIAALDWFLSSRGYRVTAVPNGAAALAAFDADPADLLITGIRMRCMDGCALIAALRTRQPDLPVVIMTSLAANTLTVKPCAARTTVFTKLIGPTELLGAICESLPV